MILSRLYSATTNTTYSVQALGISQLELTLNCILYSFLAMADLDEDVIHHPPSGDSAPQAEIDLSDEMQDFRFLNSLSLYVLPILLFNYSRNSC
jgi:hypothetical protein